MASPPRSIDDYLRTVRPEQRAALEELRRRILDAAPGAEETISYGLPAFRRGRAIVAFGAGKEHCALYPMSARVASDFAAALKSFETSKGAIRFTPDRPLPAALVRKIVRARLAENEGKAAEKSVRATAKRKKVRIPRARAASATSVISTPRRTSKTSQTSNAGSTSKSKGRKSSKDGKDGKDGKDAPVRVAARGTARAVASSRTDPRVDAWLAALENPRRADIDFVRGVVLGADRSIREALKWNAPSFRTEEFFATVHARSRTDVQIVFHRGAKVRDGSRARIALPAAVESLVKWLAPDRLIATLGSGPALRRRRAAIVALVRTWIEF